jgi:hypothetical protein
MIQQSSLLTSACATHESINHWLEINEISTRHLQVTSQLLLVMVRPDLLLLPQRPLLLLRYSCIDGKLYFICCPFIWRAGPAVGLQCCGQLSGSGCIAGIF